MKYYKFACASATAESVRRDVLSGVEKKDRCSCIKQISEYMKVLVNENKNDNVSIDRY